MKTLFISDMHLCAERNDKLTLFELLLAKMPDNLSALYILGDIFEQFWIGMDDDNLAHQSIHKTLRRFSDEHPGKLFIMRGNRDFCLNDEFANATGAQFLDDPNVIDLHGQRCLIMHGDLLCTDDLAYQRFRKFVTNSFVQTLFFLLPASIRQRIALKVRGATKQATARKSPNIIDANPKTINQYIEEHKAELLIHGHTHKQGIFQTTKGIKRIVLGDWYDKDSVLVCNENGQQLLRVNDYLAQ